MRRAATLLLAAALITGCGASPAPQPEERATAEPEDNDADDDNSPEDDPTPRDDGTAAWLEDDAVDTVKLTRWLHLRQYRATWASTPSVVPSPQGGTRVFVNDMLADALDDGVDSYPLGAAGVRELYEPDLLTPRAINLTVKLLPDDGDGTGWLWVEIADLDTPGSPPTVDEMGAPRCVGCHLDANDFVWVDGDTLTRR